MKTPSLVNSSQQPVRHIGGLERVVVIATFAILTTGGDSDYIIAAKSGDLQTPQWGNTLFISSWSWSDGSPWDFAKWRSGQPGKFKGCALYEKG